VSIFISYLFAFVGFVHALFRQVSRTSWWSVEKHYLVFLLDVVQLTELNVQAHIAFMTKLNPIHMFNSTCEFVGSIPNK